jgi:hypothetical protein
MAEKPRPQELDIPYQIAYRNIKYPRLEFKTGSLLLILPRNYKNEKQLVQKHKRWIYTKNFIIKTALETAKNKELNLNRTNEELKELVHTLAKNLNEEFHFKINKIYFKKMKTKWGSYSSKRNLTINTLLKYLPRKLIEYVVFHELTHSIERKHNERFWEIICKKFRDYEAREKDLLVYWFMIQKMF